MVNALLYVDFIDRPKCHNYDYALIIVDALRLSVKFYLARRLLMEKAC